MKYLIIIIIFIFFSSCKDTVPRNFWLNAENICKDDTDFVNVFHDCMVISNKSKEYNSRDYYEVRNLFFESNFNGYLRKEDKKIYFTSNIIKNETLLLQLDTIEGTTFVIPIDTLVSFKLFYEGAFKYKNIYLRVYLLHRYVNGFVGPGEWDKTIYIDDNQIYFIRKHNKGEISYLFNLMNKKIERKDGVYSNYPDTWDFHLKQYIRNAKNTGITIKVTDTLIEEFKKMHDWN